MSRRCCPIPCAGEQKGHILPALFVAAIPQVGVLSAAQLATVHFLSLASASLTKHSRTTRLTAATTKTAISPAPSTTAPFAALMAKLTKTSATSATQLCKYGAHRVAMKPEELEHTRIGSSWCGSPRAPVSPLVNPSLPHVPH